MGVAFCRYLLNVKSDSLTKLPYGLKAQMAPHGFQDPLHLLTFA